MILVIIGILVLAGLFNPWTGLFGDTLYAPKRDFKPSKPDLKHKSFRLTKER